MSKKIYVWEFPVRLTHWINAAGVASMAFTGFYIGNPFIHASSVDQYTMGWMRFIHFISAYALVASIFVRLYWSIVGNEFSKARVFFPFSRDQINQLLELTKFYLFIRKEPPRLGKGHSACGAFAYFFIGLVFLAEIATGFALYSQSHASGAFWTVMGGWLLFLMNVQTVRLYHHLLMWVLLTFVVGHMYIAWIIGKVEKDNTFYSMFSGYKLGDE